MLERVMIVGGIGGGDRVAAGALDVEANDYGHVKMTRAVCMQKHEILVKREVLMKHEVMEVQYGFEDFRCYRVSLFCDAFSYAHVGLGRGLAG